MASLRHFFSRLPLALAIALCGYASAAQADPSLGEIAVPAGSYSGGTNGVSGDGSTAIGYFYNSGGNAEAYYWTASGGMVGIGTLAGGSYSIAYGANLDGSVIVGYANDASSGQQAFRWTQSTGMVGLGFLPGDAYSQASGVSHDGSVVVGYSQNYGGYVQAIRWTQATGMVGLGFLSTNPYAYSYAEGVSGDGAVIVGAASNAQDAEEAFRWTQATGMQGLGFISGGNTSHANRANTDGSVVVGYASNAAGNSEAFRWTQTGGMQGLGFLAGGNNSTALGVSGDGSVVVGQSSSATSGAEAFHWTQATGMVSLRDLLAGHQVDVSNWKLDIANGISSNGNIVVGNGSYNNVGTSYIANLATGGLTTPQDLGASLNTVVQSTQQASAAATQFLPQSIFVAQHIQQISTPVSTSSGTALSEISPAAGGDYRASPLSVFMMGSYGLGQNNNSDNDQFNGTAGVNLKVSPEVNIGLGIVGSSARGELAFGGNSKLRALGGMALAAYEPKDTPLRVYGTAYAANVSVDTTRGYLNAGGTDYSHGDTDGLSYGTAIRVGWEKRAGNTGIMPYVEGRYSKTNLDAYNETGGAFATNFGEQDNESITTRIGVELTQPVTDRTQVLFRPAWGHRISGNGAAFDANTGGLTQTLQGNAGDRDWAEATVGAAWQATDRTSLSAELTGRTGNTSESQATLMVGAFVKF